MPKTDDSPGEVVLFFRSLDVKRVVTYNVAVPDYIVKTEKTTTLMSSRLSQLESGPSPLKVCCGH